MFSRPTVALLAATLLIASPARAGWGPDPVVVHPSAAVRFLDSATDGHFGAYFLWQDAAGGAAGVLHLQHVLSSGDLDPAWESTGAVVCSVSVDRGTLGLVPDGQGAVYAWWTEGTQLFARRMLASGAGDDRWPARGLRIVSGFGTLALPGAVSDDAGGLYACWRTTGGRVMLARFGPSGSPVTGWPAAGRLVGSVWLNSILPAMAPSGDGGVFVASIAFSEDTTQAQSGFYVAKIRANGSNTPGWGTPLLPTGEPHVGYSLPMIRSAADAGGGAAVLTSEESTDPFPYDWVTRLYRKLADGTTAPGWNELGLTEYSGEPAFDPRMRKVSLFCTRDGVIHIAAFGTFYVDGPENMTVQYSVSPGGTCIECGLFPSGPYGNVFEFVPDPDQGYHRIISNPCWYPNWWDPIPFTSYATVKSVGTYPGGASSSLYVDGGWPAPERCSFSPLTITPTGDGGAIAGWASTYGVTGLVAVRLGAAGAVTSVPGHGPKRAAFSARFVHGEGVRAIVTPPSAAESRLECFDVTGRLVATASLGSTASAATLPGTRGLPAGLYLLRLTGGAHIAFARVVVVR